MDHPAPVACPAARRLGRLVHQWAIDNLLIHMAGVLGEPYLAYLYEELAGQEKTTTIMCMAVYLASPAAAYITGQTLYIDGGMSMA